MFVADDRASSTSALYTAPLMNLERGFVSGGIFCRGETYDGSNTNAVE